jgi:hypothetical protein
VFRGSKPVTVLPILKIGLGIERCQAFFIAHYWFACVNIFMAGDCKAKHGISETEATATEQEGEAAPFGTDADGQALNRSYQAALDKNADPVDEGTNQSQAVPAACKDLSNATEDTQISPRFKVKNFCSGAALPHPLQANKGLSKAEIACNLRHLATNAIDPIFDHFSKLGYTIKISSGFRPYQNGSDHNIGSAADLIFEFDGRRIAGAELSRVEKAIDQVLKIPYTQMIHEANNLLHVACRRAGNNSNPRMFWSVDHGTTDNGRGYRYNVSLDGSPPVK